VVTFYRIYQRKSK